MTKLNRIAFLGFCLLLCAGRDTRMMAQDVAKIDDPQIVGKWTVTETTKNGPITLVKEHVNGITTLTAFDAAKRVLYAKTSEYHTEQHGKVRVFVFRNGKYTAGPDAGKTDKRTKSYVYRTDGKNFFEVRGMIDGVDETPGIIIWTRVDPPAT